MTSVTKKQPNARTACLCRSLMRRASFKRYGSCSNSAQQKERNVEQKRVLITGHNGYIGSVMVPVLGQAGYKVVGLDTRYFAPCTLIPDEFRVPCLYKDIRDLTEEDL